MVDILVINSKVPWPLNDGHSLRVYQLARHLPPEYRCHLVCRSAKAEHLADLKAQGVFASITTLPPLPRHRHWRRLFRLDDRHYHRLTYPAHFADAVHTIQDLVDREAVDVVVSVLLGSEEFGRYVHGVRHVVDQYDCNTVALERELAARTDLGWRERLRLRRRLVSIRTHEADLARTCDKITAISPPDVACLTRLTRGKVPVQLLPNGVDSALLHRPLPTSPPVRGIAFWGNLSFPVNRLAIRWFYEFVWRPLLQPHGIAWTIVGAHAGPDIEALSARHPEISTPGFVEDLFGHLEPYPVMVNPMVSGTGLKNKVIEAFAVGMTVVTTPMGVEAFPVRDGEHCLMADEPQEFAEAVLKLLADPTARHDLAARARDLVARDYSWRVIGERWGATSSKSGGVQSG